jgi:beta-ureidopropionase / N-carbamoyl-L-amino-acid hydrolase
MDYSDLRVDGRRLRNTLEKITKIGATAGGGVHRLALSREDKRARDLLVKWLEEIDLEVRVDELGNIFGKMPGRNDSLPAVMSGSHLDSQPRGGRFDGALGVIGALEVLKVLREKRVETERPVILANWTNEEGTRFSPAILGSGVWTGKMERDWAYGRRDVRNRGLKEELEKTGYRGNIPAQKWPFCAYYELHIEQGPVLDRQDKIIGIPEGVVSIQWHDIYVSGTSNQVGPTPMEGRSDALCAAAEMILKVNELPGKMGGDLVATVGEIHNFPNSRNIIPGKVHFTVDIRSWDDRLALRAWEHLKSELGAVAKGRNCLVRIEEMWSMGRVSFDAGLVNNVTEAADLLKYPRHSMVSGAGHDACYMSQVGPTAMIFVPSIGGRSHVEEEDTKWEDCEAGANVLLHCILRSAL